ncbi:MAG: sigma factor [Alistipes sp.]
MQRFGSACVLIVKATENEGNVLRYRHALRPLFASVVPYGPADRGDAMEAEEAMQDAFLKFARMRSCPQTAPQIEAWLVKTCVRGAIDRLRRRRKRRRFCRSCPNPAGCLPKTKAGTNPGGASCWTIPPVKRPSGSPG